MMKKIAAATLVASLAIAMTVALFPSQAQIVTAYLLRTNNGSDILNTTTFRANLGAAKSGAVTGAGLTMTTARLLGRTTSSTGAIEELTVSGCTLSAGALTCAGTGTVTSVALSLPSSILTVSGSPVTSSGALTGSLASQTANTVWAGPTTGSAAAPTFRSLVVADLPTGIPNANLANSATTVNGQTCTLGSTCTVAAAAGTLTGATLAGGVTASSLTSVGTLTSGAIGSGFTAIANSALANSSVTFAGHTVSLGGTSTIASTDLSDSALLARLASPTFSGTVTGPDGGTWISTGLSNLKGALFHETTAGGWSGNAGLVENVVGGSVAISGYTTAAGIAFLGRIDNFSTGKFADFWYGNSGSPTQVGSITYNGAITIYGTTSDKRLKSHFANLSADLSEKALRAYWPQTYLIRGQPGVGTLAQDADRRFAAIGLDAEKLGIIRRGDKGVATKEFLPNGKRNPAFRQWSRSDQNMVPFLISVGIDHAERLERLEAIVATQKELIAALRAAQRHRGGEKPRAVR